MKKIFFSAWLIAGALLLGACSQQEQEIKPSGTLRVDLDADPSFNTSRAINESAYTNIQNYTVSLYKGTELVQEALYKNWVLDYEVESGTQYTLKASYGTESVASYDELLCSGEETFTVQAGATKTVSFQCTPKAAKVTAEFSADFDQYFGDCDVTVKTQYMSTAWLLNKETVGKDLYIKAAKDENVTLTFDVKDKEGNSIKTDSKNVTVSPKTWLKITIKPDVTEIEGGKFGINVTINDQVTEEVVEIEIPNDVFN